MSNTGKAPIANLADFAALDPFFRIIEQGLAGLVQPGHFFDLLAEDITVDYVVTVPGYPRHIEGRAAVAELYRPYGTMIVLDRCFDLAVHHDAAKGVVVLEYASDGHVVGTGRRYLQPVYLRAHAPRRRGRALAGLPRPDRRVRCDWLATLTSCHATRFGRRADAGSRRSCSSEQRCISRLCPERLIPDLPGSRYALGHGH